MAVDETLPDAHSDDPATVSDGSATSGAPPQLRNAAYETFIVLLSIYSLINLVVIFILPNEYARNVVLIVDGILCIVFLGDFLYRLFGARRKGHYFFREGGWLDLLGSLPFPGLRIARVFRLVRVSGQYVSISVLAAERRSPDSNIHTASDAVWWSLVTISTVGYGDRYPVTNAGRIIGVFLLCSGVGLFSVITGFLANAFVRSKEDSGSDTAVSDQTIADLSARLATIETLLRELQARGETPSSSEEHASDHS
jgi:voltage-gated potassium channel